MAKDPTAALRDGMRLVHWTLDELRIAVFGLGSNLTTRDIERIVTRYRSPTAPEYAVLRVALNERLFDMGVDQLLASWQDLPDDSPSPAGATA